MTRSKAMHSKELILWCCYESCTCRKTFGPHFQLALTYHFIVVMHLVPSLRLRSIFHNPQTSEGQKIQFRPLWLGFLFLSTTSRTNFMCMQIPIEEKISLFDSVIHSISGKFHRRHFATIPLWLSFRHSSFPGQRTCGQKKCYVYGLFRK